MSDLEVVFRILAAAAVGFLIGLERSRRIRFVGGRTFALIATVGARAGGGAGSPLRVWIDSAPPDRGGARRAPALAGLYARWCVNRMVSDAVRHFRSAGARAA